jgi:hypothetical protein
MAPKASALLWHWKTDADIDLTKTLQEFAAEYRDGDNLLGPPKHRAIWIDDCPNAKSNVWVRSCKSCIGCRLQFRFRERTVGGVKVRTVERCHEHQHANALPTKAMQKKVAHEYVVTNGLTVNRALLAMDGAKCGVSISETTLANVRKGASRRNRGNVDSSVRGMLRQFVNSSPSDLSFGDHQIDSSATRIPFTCPPLARVAYEFMMLSPAGLAFVLDGTYKVNAQSLVLLCIGVVGLNMISSSAIVNQMIPCYFALAHVEDDGAYRSFLQAFLKYYMEVFGIDLSVRTHHVYRDAADGALRALRDAFPHAAMHRDLQHVKRNIEQWVHRGADRLSNKALLAGVIARVAFSCSFLTFEFHAFWHFFIAKLETELGEILLAGYLKEFILKTGSDGVITAEWVSSVGDVEPGYALYISNCIERFWRTLKGLMQNHAHQDASSCILGVRDVMLTFAARDKWKGLSQKLKDVLPMLVSGSGALSTADEALLNGGGKRKHRLTAKRMFEQFTNHGLCSFARHSHYPQGRQMHDRQLHFMVEDCYVLPVFHFGDTEKYPTLVQRRVDLLFAQSEQEACELLKSNHVYDPSEHHMMHYYFTVVIFGRCPEGQYHIRELSFKSVCKSQTEAMVFVAHFHGAACAPPLNSVDLAPTVGGCPAAKAKAGAQTAAKTRIKRRRLEGERALLAPMGAQVALANAEMEVAMTPEMPGAGTPPLRDRNCPGSPFSTPPAAHSRTSPQVLQAIVGPPVFDLIALQGQWIHEHYGPLTVACAEVTFHEKHWTCDLQVDSHGTVSLGEWKLGEHQINNDLIEWVRSLDGTTQVCMWQRRE